MFCCHKTSLSAIAQKCEDSMTYPPNGLTKITAMTQWFVLSGKTLSCNIQIFTVSTERWPRNATTAKIFLCKITYKIGRFCGRTDIAYLLKLTFKSLINFVYIIYRLLKIINLMKFLITSLISQRSLGLDRKNIKMIKSSVSYYFTTCRNVTAKGGRNKDVC